MADSEFILFTCPAEGCGRKFKMKRPARSGLFKVDCPHCHHPMQVRIDAPVEKTSPADNSARTPIAIPGSFLSGEKYRLTCPHCAHTGIPAAPVKTGRFAIACPECKGRMEFVVSLPTEVITGDTVPVNPSGMAGGRIVLRRKFGRNLEWPVRSGTVVIGRADSDTPSDIGIEKDPYISRRSVSIEVIHAPEGNRFVLRVLKAANPVLLNGRGLTPGTAEYIRFGDTLQMGRTTLNFEKEK